MHQHLVIMLFLRESTSIEQNLSHQVLWKTHLVPPIAFLTVLSKENQQNFPMYIFLNLQLPIIQTYNSMAFVEMI